MDLKTCTPCMYSSLSCSFSPSPDVSSIITSSLLLLFFLILSYFSFFLPREGKPATVVRVPDAPCGAEVWETTGYTWLTSERFPLDKNATYTIRGIYSLFSFPVCLYFVLFTISMLSPLPLLLTLSPSPPLPLCPYLFLQGYTKWLGDGDPAVYFATVYAYVSKQKEKKKKTKQNTKDKRDVYI